MQVTDDTSVLLLVHLGLLLVHLGLLLVHLGFHLFEKQLKVQKVTVLKIQV